jgi:hypothetical protein
VEEVSVELDVLLSEKRNAQVGDCRVVLLHQKKDYLSDTLSMVDSKEISPQQ